MSRPDGTDVNLVRYFPEIQYGLLSIKSDKMTTFDLINLQTGIRTNVGGDAVISPDKRRIAIFHLDLLSLLSKNVLAIYFVAPSGIIEEYQDEPDDWGVDSLGWADNKTIVTNIALIENSMETQSNQILRFTSSNIAVPGKWGVEPLEDLIKSAQLPSQAQTSHASPMQASDNVQSLITMISLYGGDEWDDASLSEYFDGQTRGYITPVFTSRFTENNIEKMAVIFHVTPKPHQNYRCHACTPLIGGAILAKSKDAWVIESASKILDWGNGFGEEYNLAKIGADKYGVIVRISDVHQGYEDRSVRVIASNNGFLTKVLDLSFSEAPGPGVCLERSTAVQFLNVKFAAGSNSQYFDAITDSQYNEGTCNNFKTIKSSGRYIFSNGKYEIADPANR